MPSEKQACNVTTNIDISEERIAAARTRQFIRLLEENNKLKSQVNDHF